MPLWPPCGNGAPLCPRPGKPRNACEYTTFSPSFSPETISVMPPDCCPAVTVRVSVVPFALTCTVAELPLPLTAAVGIKTTLLARTLTSMRAKPLRAVLDARGELVHRDGRGGAAVGVGGDRGHGAGGATTLAAGEATLAALAALGERGATALRLRHTTPLGLRHAARRTLGHAAPLRLRHAALAGLREAPAAAQKEDGSGLAFGHRRSVLRIDGRDDQQFAAGLRHLGRAHG